ncbi:MAG: protein kinase [Clostridiales bacterium]|jgi:TPR repeat protein|nr:protein kinase [Clostridiales bacterium]
MSFIEKYDRGDWRIVEELGKGSFGSVYKIVRKELGHEYFAALKVIPVPKETSELKSLKAEGYSEASIRAYIDEKVESIMNEVRFQMEFEGTSNIVSYQDHEIQDKEDGPGKNILLRMELLKSLESLALERTLNEEDAISIGIDICRALERLAKKGMIHRDVKPENIFVSKSGDYKLGDFGIARQIERTLTAGTTTGTPNYMAPEVFRGTKYGATVDLYSLGLVMHRILNNQKMPFISVYSTNPKMSERDEALGKRMNGGQIPAPAFASPELSKVILKACEYNPENRYKTAAEMRKALETCKNPVVDVQPEAKPVYDRNGTTVASGTHRTGEDSLKPKNTASTYMLEIVVVGIGVIFFVFVFIYLFTNAKAQYNQGVNYQYGNGVEQDYAMAVNWYLKSADQGYAPAQVSLGYCYYYGFGVEIDYAEAAKWYREAADQGDVSGQANYGICYLYGEGVEQDYAEAVKWFQKSVAQGSSGGQYALGYCYQNGFGVEQDYAEAVNLYLKSAEQGFSDAQYKLGLMYRDGKGVEQNKEEANKWFRKAAEQGNEEAQRELNS